MDVLLGVADVGVQSENTSVLFKEPFVRRVYVCRFLQRTVGVDRILEIMGAAAVGIAQKESEARPFTGQFRISRSSGM